MLPPANSVPDIGRMESMAKDKGDPEGGKPRRNGSEKLLGTNSEIGRKLGDYFKGLASEDVPDHLLELLNKLEQTENARKKD